MKAVNDYDKMDLKYKNIFLEIQKLNQIRKKSNSLTIKQL